MEEISALIQQIPIRHNGVSYFILIGVIQSFFIGALLVFRTAFRANPLLYLGWALIILSLISLDIYLCYTGLMKYMLHLNDSTEALTLLIAPLIYLFASGIINRTAVSLKKQWFHFIPAILYFISQIPYLLQSLPVKLNAYLGAYYPELGFANISEDTFYGYHLVKDQLRWFILGSFLFYLVLMIYLIFGKSKTKGKQSSKFVKVSKYTFIKTTVLVFFIIFVLILSIYIRYADDSGDHYTALFTTFVAFLTSFIILMESRFFERSWIADRYETSAANKDALAIETIISFVETNDFYLDQNANLKALSKALNRSTNQISQAINTHTGLNFNDFINQFRIEAAKHYLIDEQYKHLTIEAIGSLVGFGSKSTFYSAFKKYTSMSPKDFINTHV